MNGYVFTQKDVHREVFNNLSNRLEADRECWSQVTIYYNGTNLRGDLRIEGNAGYGKAYKKVLQMFMEEYCKS